MNTAPKPLLSRREVSRICGVHIRSVARWERQKLLTGIKFNARVTRYRAEDVERLIENASSSPRQLEAAA
jgi:DNA-binding transcriptional MerR regulator